MTKRLFRSQAEKVKTGFWSLSQNKISKVLFYFLILLLPTQLGKHFWPEQAFIYGIRLDYLSPTFYITDLLIFLIFVLNIKLVLRFFKKVNKKNLLLFLFLALSIVLGILLSKNPLAGVYGLIKLIEFLFLGVYVSVAYKSLNKNIVFICFLFGVIFESSLSFLQYINNGSIGGIFYFFGERMFNAQTPGIANASINGQLFLRPYATFSHPNVLAGFLIISMLYLFLLLPKNKYGKPLLVLGLILGTTSLLLTLSRTGIFLWTTYLLFLFGLLMFEKYKKDISNSKKLIFSLIIVVSFIFIFSIFQNAILVQRFFSTRLSEESVSQRKELVDKSIDMFLKNPIFGVGINNFYNNLSPNNVQKETYFVQPVHNIFLLILSQTGLIGILFFGFLFYKTFLKSVIDFSKNKLYLLMIFLAVVFLGMFDHYFLTLQQGQLMLTLIMGTLFSYKNT